MFRLHIIFCVFFFTQRWPLKSLRWRLAAANPSQLFERPGHLPKASSLVSPTLCPSLCGCLWKLHFGTWPSFKIYAWFFSGVCFISSNDETIFLFGGGESEWLLLLSLSSLGNRRLLTRLMETEMKVNGIRKESESCHMVPERKRSTYSCPFVCVCLAKRKTP